MVYYTITSFFNDSSRIFWSLEFVIISAIAYWAYRYVRQKHSVWEKYGLPGPKPLFIIGTEYKLLYESIPNTVMNRFAKYGKLYGTYQLLQPILVIHDPELIKQVFIKDFHCFVNRFRLRTYHKMLNQNLLFSEGQKWKRMRTIASPGFSSGKLRNMTPRMNECINKLFNYLDKVIKQNDGVIQTKQVVAGLTMDVIAWCGFNTETNANDDREKENVFLKNGLNLFQFQTMRLLAVLTLPQIMLRWLKIETLNSPEAFDYFITLTREMIRQRKASLKTQGNSLKKPNDLLQLMLDAEVDEKDFEKDDYETLTASMETVDEVQEQSHPEANGTIKRTMTEEELIANCIFFLIAGFETTSSTIAHALFQLAWNPNSQQRLHEELMQSLSDKEINSGEFYNEIMNKIPYLDAVVKETLRMYPPVASIGRMVSVDEYELNGITLKRDWLIQAPAHAIHYCKDYYENPFKFDPDRWMPENKHRLVPYTYMPFGLGPRNCIGMRFAYQEVKISIARMIMEYRFETMPDTPKTLKFAPRTPLLSTSPFKLKVSKR